MGEVSRIIKLLKTTNARLEYDDKWLYFDEDDDTWIVLQRPPYAKKNRCLYQGDNLALALEAMGAKL